MISRSHSAAPSLAIVCSAIMWGLWWIPVRFLHEHGLTGDRSSLALYAAAALAMLPILALRRGRRLRFDVPVVAAGTLFGAMLVAWNHALLVGTVVRVTLLFYTAPVWATLFGFLFLGDRPTLNRLLGIVFGLAGAATILGAGVGDLPLPRNASDWLAIAGAIMFAASATITRRGGETGEMERTFVTFALAAMIALALVLWLPERQAVSDTAWMPNLLPAGAVAVFYLIPLTWLLMWGAGRLQPGRVAILLLFEVLAAAVSAAILTDEPFGPQEWIGGALILAAAALEGRSAPPAPEHPEARQESGT